MQISLRNDDFGSVNLDPSRFIGSFGPKKITEEGLSNAEIQEAICHPIGTERLCEMAKGSKSVLIVTDDNTRMTPVKRILPTVFSELSKAGVNKNAISFLIGSGTHRAMTHEEKVVKFGADIVEEYQIIDHGWNKQEALTSVDNSDVNFEVQINKLALETDLLISIGSIYPHATSGFSGGAKTVMTGIAGEKTIENTHWMALNYSMQEILGNYQNSVRKTFNKLGKKINLAFIVNAILFEGDKVFDLVAGDQELAHKKGVELCSDVYGVAIPEQAEIVIAEAYPADIDLRQAIKAVCTADLVCKDKGVIILAADCSEGVAPQFPNFSKYGFKNPEVLYEKVNKGKFKEKLMSYTLVAIGRIISERVSAILISPNIDQKEAEHLGFIKANCLSHALDIADSMTSKGSKIALLEKASVLLPIINSSNN